MQTFISNHPELFKWLLLPLFIFLAKVIEVSMGTFRLMLISRKEKVIAPMVAFVEVLIWIFTIGIVFNNLTNVMAYLAYAAGFSTGTFMGMVIEEKMAIGNSLIRVITRKDSKRLINYLKKENYPITTIKARGTKSHVNIIFILLLRKSLKKMLGTIKKFNPRAFFSVEDVSVINEGMLPIIRHPKKRNPISSRLWGKSK